MKMILALWHWIWLRPFRHATYACGHTVKLHGKNERFAWSLSRKQAQQESCINCHDAAAISCALCGELIYPGERVALYDARIADLLPEKHVVWVDEDKPRAIGCMRWDCAPTGGVLGGVFKADGGVDLFFDGRTAAEEVFATGNAIVIL